MPTRTSNSYDPKKMIETLDDIFENSKFKPVQYLRICLPPWKLKTLNKHIKAYNRNYRLKEHENINRVWLVEKE